MRREEEGEGEADEILRFLDNRQRDYSGSSWGSLTLIKSKAAEVTMVERSAYHSRMLRFSMVNANKKRLLGSSRFEWWMFQRAFLTFYGVVVVRHNTL